MGSISAGDTAFIIVSAALVLMMTPALGLFYGGMVREKNVLSTIMQSFIMIALISFQWVYIGYSISFGPDLGGVIGDLSWFGLKGIGAEPSDTYATTIPHLLFVMYQCMFAVITPALITGAFAERIKFGPFLVFGLLWAVLVYNPVCHWIWGGGWLSKLGVMDFAGGLVVHLTSGIAALVAAILIGPRRGFGRRSFMPHNLPMTLLGTGLLWFGWFGFNAGSALAADGVAVGAFTATHLAAMAGMAAWSLVEKFHRGDATTLGAASGAIAGLATVTPAAGFITPSAAIVIGLVAGAVCYFAVSLKSRLGYDDSLDVVGIHGVGGLVGSLSIGIFASKAVNPAGADGLLYGNPSLLLTQAIGVAAVLLYAGTASFIILKVVDAIFGLRVSDEDEVQGLDLSQHSEKAYNFQ